MDIEKEKKVVKDFFAKLGEYNTFIIGYSWSVLAICFIFQFFTALGGFETMIRASVLYGADFVIAFVVGPLVGPIMGYVRILPFQTFSMNQKFVSISEILKYHPIDKNVIRKVKLEKIIKFMQKVTIASIAIYLFRCWVKGYGVSWFDLLCIFVLSFVWPVLVNAVVLYIEK